MCSVIVLLRPDHDWPVLIAANRDEMGDRPWDPPGRYWPELPDLVAGRDRLAGGSWLGRNDNGVVAAVLNRDGTLGPAPGLRSRGELVLEALVHADAVAAAEALTHLDPRAYRSFNMVVADSRDAFWLRNGSPETPVEAMPIPPGLSMLTAHDLNDARDRRVATYLPRFRAAAPPDPDAGDWQGWQALLANGETVSGIPRDSMCISTDWGFGTVSSSLLALPAPGTAAAERDSRGVWLFAAGRPDRTHYLPVTV
ncbi:MAG: NRDE family protein [Alphaproteobacteria bacterium]